MLIIKEVPMQNFRCIALLFESFTPYVVHDLVRYHQ